MTIENKISFQELKSLIKEQRNILENLKKEKDNSKINILTLKMKKINFSIPSILKEIIITKKLQSPYAEISETQNYSLLSQGFQDKEFAKSIKKEKYKKDTSNNFKDEELGSDFSKQTLNRIKKGEKKIKQLKEKEPSTYVRFSNNLFSNISINLLKKSIFRDLKRDLIKANLEFLPKSYVSVMLFTTLLSFIASIFLFIFFIFFNIGSQLPIITLVQESFSARFLKVFWVMFALPLITLIFMYLYPYLEKRSAETKIDQELPFVVIHLSAIAGSMVEPSRLFKIIISTKEYPYIGKEFTKLLNKINVYGYNIVGALRDSSFNSPSKKLSELFNGLATTITSGGDLQIFFEKRAQTLLFDYRLARERYIRAAETYMDIYISVVIAAPMIFMLLLIIIKVSGLGISLSASAITTLMILGVSIINIIFLVFLSLTQPKD
ncbi:MAG: type II secretion system F family protein [Nanoarchaeota archaeon]